MLQNDSRILSNTSAKTRQSVVMFAVLHHDELTDQVLWNGTPGFLLNGMDHPALLDALTQISEEDRPAAPAKARSIMVQMRPEALPCGLSAREKEVLHGLVKGLSYKMIAGELKISFETVRSHVKRIYEKLHVHNNTEAVAKTLQCGLLG